jgi:hypothetical protein
MKGNWGADMVRFNPLTCTGGALPRIDASSNQRSHEDPIQEELSSAPLLEGWALADDGHWMHGWFFGHPEIEDGTHGHTSAIMEFDVAIPPRWAKTESRLYRLGVFYPPAEREIRYWTQKHAGLPVVSGVAPGGGDDIEVMIAILRSTGRIRGSKIDRLERAYREEREKMTTSTGR